MICIRHICNLSVNDSDFNFKGAKRRTNPNPPKQRVVLTPSLLQIDPEKKATVANVEYRATVALFASAASSCPPPPRPLRALYMPGHLEK